jgi:hypothetical protein
MESRIAKTTKGDIEYPWRGNAMAPSKKETEERLAQLKRVVLTRGFDPHASVLKNVFELPVEFQSPAVTALAASESIKTIISFPQQIQRGRHYVSKQALLFTPSSTIHLLASIWPDQAPEITRVEGTGLMVMTVTLILLYGLLEIVAQGDTSPVQLGMEFNTVAWYHLSPPLRKLLETTKVRSGTPDAGIIYSPTAQQAIEKLPLKFSNGVKIYGLLPGEKLEDLVFQPGTWKRRLLLFRRPVSANTLIMLTSNYLVVIREELGVSHGWIISYIPRKNIIGVQNQPRDQWNDITVQLKREDQTAEYKLMLKNEAVQGWRALWIKHGGQWRDIPVNEGVS